MDKKQIEAIEALRPARDDLSILEMEFLAQALQSDPQLRQFADDVSRADKTISSAMHDVAIPAGLRDRILAALAVDSADWVAEIDHGISLPKPLNSTRINRRVWIATGLSMGVVVATVLCAFLLGTFDAKPTIGREEVGVWIKAGLDDLDKNPAWAQNTKRAISPYPVSSRIKVSRRIEWHQLSATTLGKAPTQVAPLSQTGSVLLFAAQYVGEIDLPTAPTRPYTSYRGWTCGFWREGELIYALAVRGSNSDYQNALKSFASHLTRIDRRDRDAPFIQVGKVRQTAA
jgi:hypothetical protein